MNIFFTSPDPAACARYLDDKRLVKMTLETAQILSTVLRSYWHTPNLGLYGSTHENHPCVRWAAACRANFVWLYRHGLELGAEYTFRFGREHKAVSVIRLAGKLVNTLPIGDLGHPVLMTPPPNCSGVAYFGDTVRALFRNYQECLARKWNKDKFPPRWTHRGMPDHGMETHGE